MDKLDLTKTDKAYYSPPPRPVEVNFGPLPYLAITGRGAPLGEAYTAALEALFPAAYAVKFKAKAAGQDFTVAKLEGLWWWPDEYAGLGPEQVPREVWEWKLLLRQPAFVDRAMAESAGTKPGVTFEIWDEGPCVQILHTGPYSTEPATLELVHAYLKEHGLTEHGRHHEIYLSDPRRGIPEKRKTILRIPVKKTLG